MGYNSPKVFSGISKSNFLTQPDEQIRPKPFKVLGESALITPNFFKNEKDFTPYYEGKPLFLLFSEYTINGNDSQSRPCSGERGSVYRL